MAMLNDYYDLTLTTRNLQNIQIQGVYSTASTGQFYQPSDQIAAQYGDSRGSLISAAIASGNATEDPSGVYIIFVDNSTYAQVYDDNVQIVDSTCNIGTSPTLTTCGWKAVGSFGRASGTQLNAVVALDPSYSSCFAYASTMSVCSPFYTNQTTPTGDWNADSLVRYPD